MPSTSMLRLLAADGPHPAHADRLAELGWLVGEWSIRNRLRDATGTWTTYPGRWVFGWVLHGRAIQDVLYCPDAPNRYPGTTIRCYDPDADTWRTYWHDPHSGMQVSLVSVPCEDGLALEGRTETGDAVRWSFSDITADSFRWRGRLSRAGGPFETVQEMTARRI